MRQMWTITRRETAALFYSPIAYVALSCFLFLMSIAFVLVVFHPGQTSDMRDVFFWSRFVLFLVTPLLTMSLFSEEFKSGRIEMLRTNPISPSALVLGKYAGGLVFYVAVVATLLLFVLMLMFFGGPDYHTIAASFFGLFFMGVLYVAVGLFFSACTQSQLLAAIGTLLTLGMMNIAGDVVRIFGDTMHIWSPLKKGVTQATVGAHFDDFTKGIVDGGHVVYFVTVAAFFVFMTYLVMESRNWRR